MPAPVANPPILQGTGHDNEAEGAMNEYGLRQLQSFNDRKYQPHSEPGTWQNGMNLSQTGQGVPLMLMTADEKINELQ